jgi:hypothetical protein
MNEAVRARARGDKRVVVLARGRPGNFWMFGHVAPSS